MTALYRTRITHTRTSPLRHSFAYHSYSWLVDIDHLPELPAMLRPLATFSADDHVGGGDTLRDNVNHILDEHGIDGRPLRVEMLANPRAFGAAFNPLSVYWCRNAENDVIAVIAEVHNTYRGRHCYVVIPDDGAAAVDKTFYVSPFNDVRGHYDMRVPPPTDKLAIAISLTRDELRFFSAAWTGRQVPLTRWSMMKAAAAALAVPALIRIQGISLWRKGLSIQPRPADTHHQHTQEARR